MQTVKKRGDVLDFTTIKPKNEEQQILPLKASSEAEKKVAQLRAKLRPFLEAMGEAHIKEPTEDTIMSQR